MALSFPGSPVLNQIYEAEGTRFRWDGALWLIVGTAASPYGDMDASVYDPTNIIDDAFDRGNHTGTQLAATISDFGSAVAATAAVTANTAKVTNATHTGEVTGATVLTITNGAVTLAKQADVATASVFYRKTAGTGVPEVQTLATLKTDLGLTGTNSGDQTITLTGEVTGTGTGSFAATITADSVTNVKLANMATQTIKGRTTAGTGDPEDLTPAQTRTILNVADGATANASDAALRDRSTHTGTQLSSTISDLSLTITNGVLALVPSVVAVEDFVGENTQGLLADLLVTAADSARFAGAWRSRDLGAINWYFAAQAMVLAPEAFTQAERQTFCAVAIDRGVVSPRQNTTAYTASTFVTFPSGKVFFCNIAGTTAGSAPSDAAIVTAGSFLGDGGVTWEYTGLQVPATWQWFLVDIAANLLTVVAPDSTDAYPAMLAAAAELANVNAAWLNTASTHTGNTRMQVINNLIQNGMTDELTGTSPGARLSYTFQNQLTPAGAAYTIRFLADNVEVWRGYIAQAALLTTVGSSPTAALQNAADVKTGILSTQLFDLGRFKAYVGRPNWDTITGDAVFETDFRFHLFPYLYGMLDGVTEQQTYGDDVAVYIRDEVPGLFNASLGTFPMAEGFYALGKMGLQKAFDTALWRVTSRNVANVVISDAAIVSTILDLGPPQNIANSLINGLFPIATTGSASDLSSGTLPAARFDDTAHGNRAGGSLHADVIAAGASGFMTGADKTKLNGIATGATANSSDAFLLARTNHTGTQLASTISDFTAAVRLAPGYATTVTSSGTTTLTASSADLQFFTGTLGHTLVLPDVTTLALGRTFRIVNESTLDVTVQSSGLNNIGNALGSNLVATYTCIALTGTTASSWVKRFEGSEDLTGGGSTTVLNNAPTILDLNMTGLPRVPAGTTGIPSLRMPHGVAPTTPTDGDIWTTTAGIFTRINGVTVDLTAMTPVTDLSYNATTRLLSSSTGTDVTLPLVGSDPGLMTAADKTKLDGVATGATANSSDAFLLARANHTGTQLAATISNFDAAVAANSAVVLNTAKVTNATHTGEVTGATALTIVNDVVTNAKLANMATQTFKARTTAGTGDPEDLTTAQATAMLDLFSSTLKGLVPAGGAGSTTFLRQDGVWTLPTAGAATLNVQDEGITLSNSPIKFNFVGSGVTVTEPVTDEILITIEAPRRGTASLDFGTAPGSSVAELIITGQTDILVTSNIRLWIQADTTVDHNEYEHTRILAGRVHLAAADVSAGTGFTIIAESEMRLTGLVKCRWEWS
jgi:hypothetical protein